MTKRRSKRPPSGAEGRKRDSEATLKVLLAAKKKQLKVYPSAQTYLKRTVQRSAEVGTIASDEKGFLAAAMTAAAAEEARREGHTVITVRDYKVGWERYLRAGGAGNCPPWHCARRSVMLKKEAVEKEFPITVALVED